MKNFKLKRIFSMFLSVLLVLGTISVGFSGINFNASAAENTYSSDRRLHLNSEGTFKILQVADLHDAVGYLDSKIATIRNAIESTSPDLIVLTGDNITGDNTRTSIYGGTGSESADNMFYISMKELIDEFHDETGRKIPFAVTFGNHDHEVTANTTKFTKYNSDETRYKLAVELGGIDFDNPAIDDWATGTIPIYGKVGSSKADKIVNKVIIINSGNFVNLEGTVNRTIYARPGANEDGTDNEARYLQVCEYVSNEIDSDPSVPVIAFQHIPLQEMYLSGILVSGGSIECQNTANSTITGNYQKGSKAQGGDYKEASCCSYYSTEALYNALAKDNTIGIFYGHDHTNTVYGKGTCYDKDLVQGYGGGLQGGTPRITTYTINPSNTTFVKTLTQDDSYSYPSADSYSEGTYISEIGVFFGSTYQNARTAASNAGFNGYIESFANATSTAFRTNIGDKGSSNNPIIAYKTTNDITQAIRDIRATEQISYSATQTFNDCTYTAATNNSSSFGDCNEGTDGSGTNGKPSSHPVYLYYTKDITAGDPITGLFGLKQLSSLSGIDQTKAYKLVTIMRENNNSSSDVVSWTDGTSKYRYPINLDSGVSGATRVFVGFYHTTPISSSAPTLNADGPTIVVPDTIYLTPAQDTMSTFQYYLNNNTNGTAKAGYETQGKIFFDFEGASNIKASLSGSNVTNISLTNGTEASFTGALTTGIAANNTTGNAQVLTWSFTYTIGGKTNTVYAYTVVYAPLTSAVASGYTTRKGTGTANGRFPSMGDIVWATGLNGYTDNGGQDAKGGMTYQPMFSNQIDEKTLANVPSKSASAYLTWDNNGYGYSGYYYQDKTGINNVGKYVGKLVVDTSRYSTYTLPNLSFGADEVMINASALDGTLEHSTQSSSFSCSYPGAGSTDSLYNVSYTTQTILPGGTRDESTPWKTVYHFNNTTPVTAGTIGITASRAITDTDGTPLSYTNKLNINVTTADKTALRESVLTAYKYQLSKDLFTEASWNAFMENIKDNALKLGNPDSSATTTSIDTNILSSTNSGSIADVDYTITYNLNDGTVSGTNLTTNNSLKGGFTLVNPTKSGYTFLGWSEENDMYIDAENGNYDEYVSIPKGNTENLSYTANWANNYTVNYDANEGSGTTESSSHVYGIESALSTNGFTRTGYTFSGWNTQANGKGTSVTTNYTESKLSTEPNGVVTLYAQWTINSYTITFEGADGTVLKSDSVNYNIMPTAPSIPSKSADADYHYTGTWDKTVSAATENATYTVTYTPVTHSGGTATCTEKAKCSTCGTSYGDLAEHSFTAQTATDKYLKSAATCTEKAVYYKSCTACGLSSKGLTNEATFTNGEILGHDWDDGLVHNPTCTVAGYTTYTCQRAGCSETKTVAGEKALDHDFTGTETIITAATCLAPGSKTIKCTRCNETKTVAITQLNHSYTGTIRNNNDGTHSYKCINGCNGYGNQTSCSYSSTVKTSATCSTKGTTTYTCNDCKYTYDAQDIDTIAHTFTVLQSNETTHWYKCANCSATDTATSHTGGTATCTSKAVCSVCNTAYGEYDSANHDFSAEIATDDHLKTPATCTAPAEYYKSCSRCGANGTTTFTSGSKLNHNFDDTITENVTITPATCTTNGSKVVKCSRCDTMDTTVLTMLNHNYTEKNQSAIYLKDSATCTTKAVYYYKCARCESKSTETYEFGDALGHNFSGTAQNVESGKHNYKCIRCDVYGVNTTINATEDCSGGTPTCTDKAICSICNTEYGKKLGHKYDNASYTWTKTGETYTCTALKVCENDATHTITETVTASRVLHNASCTADGNYEYTATFTDTENFSEQTKTETITKTGHSMTKTDAKSAECEATGNNEYYYCSNCKKCFKDINGLTETTVKDETIKALGHDYGEWVSNSDGTHTKTCKNDANHKITESCSYGDATCTQAAKCSVCGYETGKAIGHTFKGTETVITPATCTTNGSKTVQCIRCTVTETVEIPAIGHSFAKENGIQNVSDGKHNYKCANCDVYGVDTTIGATENCSDGIATCTSKAVCTTCNTVYGDVDSTNHDFVNHVAKTATCTENGWDTYRTCSRCDYSSKVIIPATGHSFDKTNGIQNVESGKHNYKCTNCDTYGVGTTANATENCSGGTATCTAAAICSVCNTSYGSKDFSNHSTTETVTKNNKTATCKEDGYTGDEYCKDCNNLVKTGEVVLKSTVEHTWNEGTITTVPKCASKGAKTFTCTVCSATKTTDLDAIGHSMTTIDYKPETCNEAGNNEYYYCSTCNKYFKDIEGKTETTVEAEKIKATNHDYGSFAYDGETAKTHTKVCSHNSSHKITEACSFNDGVVTTKSTCINFGVKTYTCSVCGGTYTEQIEKLTPILVPETPATPTAEGTKEHYTDSDGNLYILDEDGTTLLPVKIENLILEKVEITKVPAKEATPTEEGNVEYYSGNDGNNYLKDGDNYKLVIDEDAELKIKKVEVTYVPAKEATPTEEGNIEYYSGKNGKNYTKTGDIYTEVTKVVVDKVTVEHHDRINPTPTAEGTIEYYSGNNGKNYIKDGDIYTVVTKITIDKVTVEHHNKVEATPNSEGVKEYWHGNDGKDYLKNGDIYTLVKEGELVIEKVHVDFTTEKAATVNADGMREHYSDSKGNLYELKAGVYVSTTAEKLRIAKIDTVSVAEVPATTNADGEKEHWEDAAGNKYVIDENGNGTDLRKATDIELRLAKIQTSYVTEKTSTANEEGVKAHWEDKDGNKYVIDENGNGTDLRPATDEELRIEKVEMTKYEASDATDTADGNEEYYVDANNNVYVKDSSDKYVLSDMDSIVKHWKSTKIIDVHPATCIKNGSHTVVEYCSNCNKEFKRTVITDKAIGHNFTETSRTETVNPTCTKTGGYSIYYECQNCHETKVENVTIAALRHIDENGDLLCDRCGADMPGSGGSLIVADGDHFRYQISLDGVNFKAYGNDTFNCPDGIAYIRVTNSNYKVLVNGSEPEKNANGDYIIRVTGGMLVTVVEKSVPDAKQSLSFFEKLIQFLKTIFGWIGNIGK